MQLEFAAIPSDPYDLCVVGSGPAGLIVAMEYLKQKPAARVLVLEYGHGAMQANRLDDTIVITNPKNHHDPYECTNKDLGGTSKTWGGRCVLYDEIDFLPREVIGDECTWTPAIFESVRNYLARTAEYFDCGEPKFNLHEIPEFAGQRIAEKFEEGDFLDSPVERWSLPTRFGEKYREALNQAPNLAYVLGCEVVRICLADDSERVETVAVRDVMTGQSKSVTAKRIVLAAGAQETTRLLLKNPHVFRRLGGTPEALGRYYQGHVSGKIASIKFYGDPRKTDYGFLKGADGVYIRRRFHASTQALLKHNLLNTALWLDNPLYFDPAHGSGTLSFIYMMMLMPVLGKRLAPPAIAHSVTKGKAYRLGAHLGNVLRGLPKSLLEPASIFLQRYRGHRRLPGVFFYNRDNTYALHFHAEQVPSVENRMELAEDGETLKISYSYLDADVDSVIRTHELLDETLRKSGCGELVYWYPRAELPRVIRENSKDGIHQVGTIRMASDPSRGVVDTDLRVWGTENLYVCSSAVFPTSGQANPTFMLGTFAVRLAHHLATV